MREFRESLGGKEDDAGSTHTDSAGKRGEAPDR